MLSEVEYYKKVATETIRAYFNFRAMCYEPEMGEENADEQSEEDIRDELGLGPYEFADYMGWDAEEEPYDMYVKYEKGE